MKPKPLYTDTITKTLNCPQCGYELPLRFKWAKLVQCPACKSSIFLEDEGAKVIGTASTLSPEPSLINLHDPIIIDNQNYLPLGKIRYSYGRGFWEEWFLTNEQNREFWLSIDEGDFVLEHRIQLTLPFQNINRLTIGKAYGEYIVTEIGEGECVGFEGELPKQITIGKKHRYVHLSKGGSSLMTVESSDEGIEIFQGNWIDPFEIQKVYG